MLTKEKEKILKDYFLSRQTSLSTEKETKLKEFFLDAKSVPTIKDKVIKSQKEKIKEQKINLDEIIKDELEEKGGELKHWDVNIFTDPIETIKRSFRANIIEPAEQLILHPIDTAINLIKITDGITEHALDKFLPKWHEYILPSITGETEEERQAIIESQRKEKEDEKLMASQFGEAMKQLVLNRYGSLEKAKNTAITDPIGFLMDVSLVVGGSAKLVQGAAKYAKMGKTVQIAGKTAKVAEMLDPLNAALKGAGKIVKKGGKLPSNVDPEMLEVLNRLDIDDLPASVVTTDKITPVLESSAIKNVFGQKLVRQTREAQEQLIKISDDIVAAAGGAEDLTTAGNRIIEGVDNYHDVFSKRIDEMYAPLRERANEIPAILDNTEATLKEIIKQKTQVIGKPQDVKYFQELLDDIQLYKEGKKSFTLNDIKNTKANVWSQKKSYQDPFTTRNEASLSKLYGNLMDDYSLTAISDSPELAGAFKAADKTFREGIEKMNSTFGKLVQKAKDKPSTIIPTLKSKRITVEEIPKIYELIGKENISVVQANILDDIFKNARSSVTGNYTPSGITKQIEKYGESKLQAMLSKEQLQALKDIEKVNQKFSRLTKITEGSQTAFIESIQRPLQAIGATAGWGVVTGKMSKILVGAFTVLPQSALALFTSSSFGQKVLKEGMGEIIRNALTSSGTERVVQTLRAMRPVIQAKEQVKKNKLKDIFKNIISPIEVESKQIMPTEQTKEERQNKLKEIFEQLKKGTEKVPKQILEFSSSLPKKINIPKSARLAFVNNNPGNLRYVGQAGASQGEGNFAKFNSVKEGFQALINQIKLDASRGHTLESFIYKYAPPIENVTNVYLDQIAKWTGYAKKALLNTLDPVKLAKAMAKKECSATFS